MMGINPARRAYVLIQVVLMLLVLIGFVALTTDYGLMVVKQRHLQNATDAAALAAGPALRPEIATQTAIDFATAYRGYNNATGPTPTVVDDASGRTLTVSATETVQTPFAHVLNSAWASRDVHATTKVRGQLSMEDGWWRPLSLMTGPGGIPSVLNKWLNKPCNITLKWGGVGKRYDDAQNVDDNVLWTFPVDLHNTGYPGAEAEYISMVEGLSGGALVPPNPKKPGWYPETVFVDGNPTKNNTISADNLEKWWQATYTAIEDLNNPNSIASRTGPGSKWASDTPQVCYKDNPRFAVLLESNRSVGSETTKPGGYVGFYIQSFTIDRVNNTAYITGVFVTPAFRADFEPSSAPSTWTNYGIFTYWLVQ